LSGKMLVRSSPQRRIGPASASSAASSPSLASQSQPSSSPPTSPLQPRLVKASAIRTIVDKGQDSQEPAPGTSLDGPQSVGGVSLKTKSQSHHSHTKTGSQNKASSLTTSSSAVAAVGAGITHEREAAVPMEESGSGSEVASACSSSRSAGFRTDSEYSLERGMASREGEDKEDSNGHANSDEKQKEEQARRRAESTEPLPKDVKTESGKNGSHNHNRGHQKRSQKQKWFHADLRSPEESSRYGCLRLGSPVRRILPATISGIPSGGFGDEDVMDANKEEQLDGVRKEETKQKRAKLEKKHKEMSQPQLLTSAAPRMTSSSDEANDTSLAEWKGEEDNCNSTAQARAAHTALLKPGGRVKTLIDMFQKPDTAEDQNNDDGSGINRHRRAPSLSATTLQSVDKGRPPRKEQRIGLKAATSGNWETRRPSRLQTDSGTSKESGEEEAEDGGHEERQRPPLLDE